jgi:hypothetical protein
MRCAPVTTCALTAVIAALTIGAGGAAAAAAPAPAPALASLVGTSPEGGVYSGNGWNWDAQRP